MSDYYQEGRKMPRFSSFYPRNAEIAKFRAWVESTNEVEFSTLVEERLNLHITFINGKLEIIVPMERKVLETDIVNQWQMNQFKINHQAWRDANPEDSDNE